MQTNHSSDRDLARTPPAANWPLTWPRAPELLGLGLRPRLRSTGENTAGWSARTTTTCSGSPAACCSATPPQASSCAPCAAKRGTSPRSPGRSSTSAAPRRRSTSSDYCNDEQFRRRILVQLNRGEGRHALSRDVCHGRRGELRQAYRQGQEEQLGALGLIVNTIVLYNTIYTQRALDHITDTTGTQPRDEDIERLSPLGTDHTTLTGRYRVLLPAPLHDRSAYRPLNTPEGAAAA